MKLDLNFFQPGLTNMDNFTQIVQNSVLKTLFFLNRKYMEN